MECQNPDLPPLTGRFVQKLYAHDDAKGPFAPLEVLHTPAADQPFPFALKSEKWDILLHPKVISIPVPGRIRVSYLDVLEWVNRFHEAALFLADSVRKTRQLNWDIVLTTTNQFKADLSDTRRYPVRTARKLRLATHPEYLWRVRLEINNKTVLELYADATEAPRTFPFYDLAVMDREYGARLSDLLSKPANTINVLKPVAHEFLLKSLQGLSLSARDSRQSVRASK
jgi:hypothetical protein